MSYVIEHNIPPPPPTHKRRGPAGQTLSPLTELLRDMPVGSSFLVKTEKERHTVTAKLYRHRSRVYAVRKVPGEGWRVWRVE